jgi:hypothetical protein
MRNGSEEMSLRIREERELTELVIGVEWGKI